MSEQSDIERPDPDFGVVGDTFLTREELTAVCPDAEMMVEQMGLQVGDVIQDGEDGLCHVVSQIRTNTEKGGLLLDCPTTETYDDLHKNGIDTTLIPYYARWRRGTVTKRAHWEQWDKFTDELKEAAHV